MQIVVTENQEKGIEKAKEILYEKVSKKTVLFLSGGSTPKSLYQLLAKENIIHPASVGMVDERYGAKFHKDSNELMIRETGLLAYLDTRGIPFFPILKGNTSREKAAQEYDQITRDLFFKFHKSIAIMGVGADGHISSIIPNREDFTNPLFSDERRHLFVDEFNDPNSSYGERIGMTFTGLHLIDTFIVLIFGKEKEEALQKMFTQGSLEEIPARFFQQEASEKTIIITDLKV